MEGDSWILTNSLAFKEEWSQKLSKDIITPFKSQRPYAVFVLQQPTYRIDNDELAELIYLLLQSFPELEFYFIPHTSNSTVPKRIGSMINEMQNAFISKSHYRYLFPNTICVLNISSSIGLCAIAMKKPYIDLSYITSNLTVFELEDNPQRPITNSNILESLQKIVTSKSYPCENT